MSNTKLYLEKVCIRNFKGIKKLEFSPKRINILLGPNNVGKTSVLEAIYIALIGVNFEDLISKYKLVKDNSNAWQRLFFARSKYEFREFDLFFRNREHPFEIQIKIRGYTYNISFDRSKEMFKIHSPLNTILYAPFSGRLGGEFSKVSYCFLYPYVFNSITVEDLWDELSKRSRNFEGVKSILKEFGIENLELSYLRTAGGKEAILHYKVKNGGKYPIFTLGSGVRTALALALLSEVADIVLFDDFEAAIHPDTANIIGNI